MKAAEPQNVGKRTVCWATPEKNDEHGYDDYSIKVGKMRVPYEMMKCNKTSGWLGLREQRDCVLELEYGKEYRIVFNQNVTLNSD